MEKPVPGFEDYGVTWSDEPQKVTVNIPVTREMMKTFKAYTDGRRLTLNWAGGSVRSRGLRRAWGGGWMLRAAALQRRDPMTLVTLARRRSK